MTKFQRSVIVASVIGILFFVALGIGGDYDYCDQIILNMSQEEYDSIRLQLMQQNVSHPTDRDIAHWWADHHKK